MTPSEPRSDGWSRPPVQTFGPASRQTRITARALRVTAKPALYGFALSVRAVNRRAPDLVQRISFAGTDLPGLLLPPPRGTTVESAALPYCRAEWVTASAAGGPACATVIYFHGGGFIGPSSAARAERTTGPTSSAMR
ncbi:hypothetical protein ACQPW1_08675 [Nocardia sp. CA-128927]|uniref:hypothetical protein n=1 Tax=Nocardia sp. CA-128927 TaxID=3239975 RepID=UPI003D965072